jgi:hypothetical protein
VTAELESVQRFPRHVLVPDRGTRVREGGRLPATGSAERARTHTLGPG